MSCEEIQQSLSSYVDDSLMLPVRVAVDEHVDKCPVCRNELVELRALTRGLSMLSRPQPPFGLAESINQALMIEAAARNQSSQISLADRVARFLEPRLMPYSIGWVASIILFVAMFAGLRPHFQALHEAAAQSSAVYVVPASAGYDLYKPVTSEDYAASRAPFAEQSPSLNPKGALATLTRSYAHPHNGQDADDMLVVADVFSNGAASLVDVVHAPRDRQMLSDFQAALRRDAAFVPASMDRRPDTMRVVFAVQKVDVRERNF
ncbi:MAG TPA: zf-HC2 domain-containing protein [Pyrinomonadaceae bacterium]|nr:zf-HC2 domain-containing protein [Pyrinomonadaceae bacterium]